MNSTTLRLRMESLTVLSNLRNTEVYKAYEDTMSALYTTPVEFCQKYAQLCRFHFENRDLGKLLAQEIHFDINVLTISRCRQKSARRLISICTQSTR